jgi:uncharacterized membrane protein
MEEKSQEDSKMESAPSVPQVPAASSGADKDKGMAALAYLGILLLIPLLAKKDDSFVKFHVQQGLVLLVAGVVWWVIELILAFTFFWLIIAFIGWVLLLVLMIMGIVNAVNGVEKSLPIIGSFSKYFKL